MAEERYKWRGQKRRWSIADMSKINLGSFEFLHMKTEERADLAMAMWQTYVKRRNAFERAGTKGYALEKLKDDFQSDVITSRGITLNMPPVIVKGRTRTLNPAFLSTGNPQNALSGYISLLQEFITAKSSTVKGWAAIAKEQDARLFGERYRITSGKRKGEMGWRLKRGQYRMSDEERVTFWKVYNELYKASWSNIADYSSDSQREVASYFATGEFNGKDLEEIVTELKKRTSLHPERDIEAEPGDVENPTAPALDGDTELYDNYIDW